MTLAQPVRLLASETLRLLTHWSEAQTSLSQQRQLTRREVFLILSELLVVLMVLMQVRQAEQAEI
jgi:hypothetical protein